MVSLKYLHISLKPPNNEPLKNTLISSANTTEVMGDSENDTEDLWFGNIVVH